MAGDELDKFVAEILEAKQLSGVNDDVRAQLLTDLKQQLMDQINRALIEAMSEERLGQFNDLIDSGDVSDEELFKFIVDSGIDVQKVTAQTMMLFRSLYLQTAEEREG